MADRNYFCVENIADFSENIRFVANKSFTYPVLEYSLDDGWTWVVYSIGSNIPLAPNTKCYFRGNNSTFNSNNQYIYFTSDHSATQSLKNLNISGNIMSLVDKTCDSLTIPCEYCFYALFTNNQNFNNTLDLALPATTLKGYCYKSMFYGCTSLTTAPELPATTLATNCYHSMFYRCFSLITPPKLPATILADYCYGSMFNGCTSLILPPELPATILANNCYSSMFSSCTSLNKAPKLPATRLSKYCYYRMFNGCQSLTIAPELLATTLETHCYESMFSGCTSLTTAPELPATTLNDYCCQGMFYGCTSLTIAPDLPATTLALNCYSRMFYGCTGLTTPPELPAAILKLRCYDSMFFGCISLEHIPALPAKILNSWCYERMFDGCSSIKLSEVPTEECVYKYRLPILGNIRQTDTTATLDMFTGTGGVTTIELNKDYFTNVKVIPNYINYQINNLAFTTTAEAISQDLTDITIVLSSIDCFKLPETVIVVGADCSYNSATGEIVLTNLTDNITVMADGVEILPTPQVYLNYNTLNISPIYRADNYEINFEEVK